VRAWEAQYRFRCADGSYASVHDRAYVEYGEDGAARRAVGAMSDVTDQQRAEVALDRQASFVRLSREVAVTANQAESVGAAMGAILRLVCEHTGWPLGHALMLQRAERQTPPPNVWHEEEPGRFAEFRAASDGVVFARGVGLVGRIWETGKPVWVPIEGDAVFTRRDVALRSGLRAAFGCPILVGTAVVGILEFFADDTVPPAADLVAVLVGVGTQLGRVVERALAEGHLRDYAERLESLSRRLIDAQEAERRHVARELHDEIGQALTALKLNLQSLAERPDADAAMTLEESIDLADRTLQQTRDLSLGLRPALLDDLGLVPALRWYLDRQGRRAGFTTEFAVAAVDDAVPPEVATTCFRIAQEALTNVARHARATKVTMELSRRDAILELVVRDSGRGFDPSAAARANGHRTLGILSMGERAALVGGELTIDSAVGRGTEVRVRLPLASANG
jgi:signal transduction histidine kinase